MAARIIINPSTFKNEKSALCVAMNERFRIAMEQYGFEPQSEPTDRQRRFFADTAYADDEVQLRRTILARILTLDTSVKDPTDEQLQEAVAFLQEFKRRERPSNDWEASAIDRLEVLVQTVVNKGRRAVPKPQGGTVRADVGGGTTEDDEEAERANAEVGNDFNAGPAEPMPLRRTPKSATTSTQARRSRRHLKPKLPLRRTPKSATTSTQARRSRRSPRRSSRRPNRRSRRRSRRPPRTSSPDRSSRTMASSRPKRRRSVRPTSSRGRSLVTPTTPRTPR